MKRGKRVPRKRAHSKSADDRAGQSAPVHQGFRCLKTVVRDTAAQTWEAFFPSLFFGLGCDGGLIIVTTIYYRNKFLYADRCRMETRLARLI